MFRSLSSLFLLISLSLFSLTLRAQNHQDRYESMDVISYSFELDLNDSTDVIRGRAEMEIKFLKELDQFYLDLSYDPSAQSGMKVHRVTEDDKEISFKQDMDRLALHIPPALKNTKRNYRIHYSGVPSDGLIISENKFGDRTFFGDNWPNRGRHWLPTVDHPSDKALVEFIVLAPEHYQVVSVGTLKEELRERGRVRSHWQTDYPLSTKMMVIGVSPFEVEYLESSSGIPVSSWVYPQNKEEGFLDYSMAIEPLDFFESYLAPYPFDKLANVQSKTVYGGMENASCIFYHERSVTGKQRIENLLAHEIAHQWFGDAVSEMDWHHIWLSEGFATYLTDLYIEHAHGREAFVASLEDERGQVLRFAKRRLAPIVDTTLPVSVRLLSTNSYEKAAWVLHMLRYRLGDKDFQLSLQTFYEQYKFGNVLTDDFLRVVESVSGEDYGDFFRQWFHRAGHPVLSLDWEQKGRTLEVTLQQHQEAQAFQFPLEIEISGKKGKSQRQVLQVDKREHRVSFKIPFKAKQISLDPDTWLLYELYQGS